MLTSLRLAHYLKLWKYPFLVRFFPVRIWFFFNIIHKKPEIIKVNVLGFYFSSSNTFFVVDLFLMLDSSHPEGFCKKVVLKNFTTFAGKHLYRSLFFNKIAGLQLAALSRNKLWHRCFPVNSYCYFNILFG